MFSAAMSVAERASAFRNVLSSLGIHTSANLCLEQVIMADFALGNKSKFYILCKDLQQGSSVAQFLRAVGSVLKIEHKDPQIQAVAAVMVDRLPQILEIIDVRSAADKRALLLEGMLGHFKNNIPRNPETERLLRMLEAAQKNIRLNVQSKLGDVQPQAENFACTFTDLAKFSKTLQDVTPALLALEAPSYATEHKINLCINALRALSHVLRATHMEQTSRIVDKVQWLGKLALPYLGDKATIEEALKTLGISLGTATTKMLLAQGATAGLTHAEMVQVIYACGTSTKLSVGEQLLIDSTLQNQRHAALCGFVASLAQELNQPELHKLSIAGICLASMRQTYCELKANNLNANNVSESLGTILLGAGNITQNKTLAHVGKSILSGAQAYAGVMAVPGGAAVAIPLALCSVLGALLTERSEEPACDSAQMQEAMQQIMQQVLNLQQQMRLEFADLYKVLHTQHKQLLLALDQSFSNIEHLLKFNNALSVNNMRLVEQKLQDIQAQISQEFTDLYLEYVQDPLEEVDYATRYGAVSSEKLEKSKHKLAMWLLYKSKHPKVNGSNHPLTNIATISAAHTNKDNCLSLINRYVNTNFSQNLPDNLPHLSTWVQAAHAYALIGGKHVQTRQSNEQLKFLEDVLAIGKNIVQFIENLADNTSLWQDLQQARVNTAATVNQRWETLRQQIQQEYLQDMHRILATAPKQNEWFAQAAAMNEQLEVFTPPILDISALWQEHIAAHIPQEVYAAIAHGLGTWQITYVVDKKTNTFTDLHIPHGDPALPNYARDVLYRVDVAFKVRGIDTPYPLTSTWLAYDLQSPKHRMDQYYKQKFKFGLRHSRYNWISIDGMANQVEGHANTTTHKIIDYDKVGNIYQNWFYQAKSISEPAVLQRLSQNPQFVQHQSAILKAGESTQIHTEQIVLLRAQICERIRALMCQKRAEYAAILQQDSVLRNGLEKLDVYDTIVVLYGQLLNVTCAKRQYISEFNLVLQLLQQTDTIEINLVNRLDSLFVNSAHVLPARDKFQQGEFYKQLQTVLARLALLQTNVHVERLRYDEPL